MSVSQPSVFLNWDTNNVNLLTPPSSFLQNGYVPGMAPDAEYDNYALQLLDLWIQYLQQQQSSNGGFTTITTSQTLTTAFASWFFNPTGGNLIATLPTSIGCAGQIWRIKNIEFSGGHKVTVQLAQITDKLEGTVNGTFVINDGEILAIQSDGAGNFFEVTP